MTPDLRAAIVITALAALIWLIGRARQRHVDFWLHVDAAIALTIPPIGDATAAHIAAQEAAGIDGEWAEMGGGAA